MWQLVAAIFRDVGVRGGVLCDQGRTGDYEGRPHSLLQLYGKTPSRVNRRSRAATAATQHAIIIMPTRPSTAIDSSGDDNDDEEEEHNDVNLDDE